MCGAVDEVCGQRVDLRRLHDVDIHFAQSGTCSLREQVVTPGYPPPDGRSHRSGADPNRPL